MNEKKPIDWTLKDQDPYYRISTDLYDSDVEYEDETTANNTSERLSKTTLKAIQDTFYAREKSRELVKEDAEQLTESIFKKYYEIRRNKLIGRYNRMAELPLEGEAPNPKKVDDQLTREAEELQRLAAKEAWRIVNIDSIPEEDLTLRFYSSPIAKVANIKNLSSTNLFEEVGKLQNRFNRWTEKVFDEESGEVIYKKYRSTLLPTAALVQRGKGYRNYIEVKLNRDMLHLVMFLRRNYLRFHLEISVAFNDQKTSTLYEQIVKMITLKKRDEFLSLEDAKKLMGVKIKQSGVFKQRHIVKRIAQINERLNTSIVLEDVKEGRRIIGFRFIASELDRQLLMGERAGSDFFREDMLYSFGYYLALLDYHKAKIPKSRIGIKAIEYEEAPIGGDLETTYGDYKENLKSYHELLEVPEDEYPSGCSLDVELLTLVDENGIPFSNFAYGCMMKMAVIKDRERQNSLPGLSDRAGNANWEMSIRDLMPFGFLPPGQKKKIVVSDENFGMYQKRIEAAIKFKDSELFVFDNKEKEEFFSQKIIGRSKKTVDAELIVPGVSEKQPKVKSVMERLSVLDAFAKAFEKEPAKWEEALLPFVNRSDDIDVLVKHLQGSSRTAKSNLAWISQLRNFGRDFDEKVEAAMAEASADPATSDDNFKRFAAQLKDQYNGRPLVTGITSLGYLPTATICVSQSGRLTVDLTGKELSYKASEAVLRYLQENPELIGDVREASEAERIKHEIAGDKITVRDNDGKEADAAVCDVRDAGDGKFTVFVEVNGAEVPLGKGKSFTAAEIMQLVETYRGR